MARCYTLRRSERKVSVDGSQYGSGILLVPLIKVVRQWSDRKKKLEVPLFLNYVYVKIDSRLRAHLYSIKVNREVCLY
jgi:transcriptional antiterminator RfaH